MTEVTNRDYSDFGDGLLLEVTDFNWERRDSIIAVLERWYLSIEEASIDTDGPVIIATTTDSESGADAEYALSGRIAEANEGPCKVMAWTFGIVEKRNFIAEFPEREEVELDDDDEDEEHVVNWQKDGF
jgi:hypothetical protein